MKNWKSNRISIYADVNCPVYNINVLLSTATIDSRGAKDAKF